MTRVILTKLGQTTCRGFAAAAARRATIPNVRRFQIPLSVHTASVHRFSTTSRVAYPLSPEALKTAKPAPIADSQYHELADVYLESLLVKYEELQDEKGDIDVEFSSGVMTVKIPGNGTYVINKQPPNKQIWLSSPVSGPKRYDYVIVSEGQGQKQDTGAGDWVYLRDGSTLGELLLKETGVEAQLPTE
ncbi:Frataxin-like domain-containing protein [Hypoxylon fuscum]|nr:Frataxin-like domain-containing protein [Hypoxylon fuscum]